MEFDKKICPIIKVDGVIERGKQFDIDITLPEDNRNVIYGVIKDCYKEPIADAVVKLIEVDCEHGKEERKPVAHTFTNEDGEFVFGPLCPHKVYEINIWVDAVKHIKVCAKCKHEGKCLKGVKLDCCDFHIEPEHCHPCKPHNPWDEHDKDECKDEHKRECK